MLDELREIIVSLWSPVGELFNSILGSSNVWFPIIAYVVGTILLLFVIRKILDMTVSGASTLSLKVVWSLLKKLLFYGLIIGVGTFLLISLYFYLESIYQDYNQEVIKKEHREQSVDYLLR